MRFLIALFSILLTIPTITAITVFGNSSVYTFNITCTTTPASLTCAAAPASWTCTIDNAAFINYAELKIDNAWYNTTQNVNNFTTLINYASLNTTTNTTINLTQQRIHDTSGGYVNAFIQTSTPRDCAICTPTYQIIQACNTTNEEIINTTYTPAGCNNDTITTQACIYCTPTWIARTGGVYECDVNNTKLQYYDDYSTCCALSPINCIYPADHNTIIPCGYYSTDMNCQYDAQPYLSAKINMACTLPAQYANATANCITYVRKANQTLLIQSNPEYADVPSLMFWKESETRQSFTNTNRIVNAYYTNKHLQTGQEFILGMKCTTNTGAALTSEYAITPTYQPPASILNRIVWASDNWAYVIIFLLGVILLILAVAWTIKKLRGR